MASGGQNGPLRAWQKKGAFRPGLSWCNVEGESGLTLERAGSPSLSASGALGELQWRDALCQFIAPHTNGVSM